MKKKYPTLSIIRPRIKEQTQLEHDLKMVLLISSISSPDHVTPGSIWENLAHKFQRNSIDIEATRKGIFALNAYPEVSSFVKLKIDIEDVRKWKQKLKTADKFKIASDVVCILDIPFNEFMELAELDGQAIVEKLLKYLNLIDKEYTALEADILKKKMTSVHYEILMKGKEEEKKKALDEMNVLPWCHFLSGDLNTKCKKIADKLKVSGREEPSKQQQPPKQQPAKQQQPVQSNIQPKQPPKQQQQRPQKKPPSPSSALARLGYPNLFLIIGGVVSVSIFLFFIFRRK